MDRDALQAKRDEYAGEVKKIEAILYRLQGAIAALDELLAAEPAEGDDVDGTERTS